MVSASRRPSGRAAEQLPWFRRWDRVFEWNYPTFRWFIGGETNLAYNALDRHVAGVEVTIPPSSI